MSEQTEQRETNLRRWSELAPNECEIWKGRFRYTTTGYVVLTGAAYNNDSARLVCALIDAICAREGWEYSLTNVRKEHLARVIVPHKEPFESLAIAVEQFAAEPCDALLSAYVQALEAMKESA